MAVVMVVGALAIPALSRAGAAALSGEGNRIASLFEFARQHALTRNVPAALVVVSDPSSPGYRKAFALVELPMNSNGEPVWRQVSAWETLRDGVVVFQSDTPDPPSIPVAGLRYQGAVVNAVESWVFLPSGGLMGNRSGRVILAEGFTNPGAAGVTLTGSDNGTPRNPYQITVLATSGRTHVERK